MWFKICFSCPDEALLGSDQGWEASKGLKGKPPGVQFHHFLEMTTQSRCRISEILGEQQTIQLHAHKNADHLSYFYIIIFLLSLQPPDTALYAYVSFIWILILTNNFDTEDGRVIYFVNTFFLVILV